MLDCFSPAGRRAGALSVLPEAGVTALTVRSRAESSLCELAGRSGRGDQEAFAEFYAVTIGYVTALLRTCQPDRLVERSAVDTYRALWADAGQFDLYQVGVWPWIASHTYRVVRATASESRTE